MMKHVHKLFTGESNPWTDWIRFWYDEGRADEDTPCWRDIKKLIPEYRAITAVALGDGETTSFWHDTWSEAGILRDALPALYSHCLDVHATVAEVVASGGLQGNDLQPRLTAAATADLGLLGDALAEVALRPESDERWLQGHRSNKVRAGDLYAVLWAPIGGPPLSDINWDSFAPKKVKVFFWILRHGRTKTRGSLRRHGAIDSPDCPFCPGTPEEENHLFSAEAIARHLQAHLGLWVCRAPTKLDVEGLKLWCQTVVDVN
ncbi:unnamed protein product [Urochloa decumbens]|uniref:Reverse transcriptase zinc-binding domain-containing protein n=1 Tax=Urochloa decumbens TaxID=240449 RepID=A0ABC8VDR6_9POAL